MGVPKVLCLMHSKLRPQTDSILGVQGHRGYSHVQNSWSTPFNVVRVCKVLISVQRSEVEYSEVVL